jgi:hypothetical protein
MMEAIHDSGFTPVPEEVRLTLTGTIEARGRGFVLVLDRMKEPKAIVCVTSGPDDPLGAALADHAGKPVAVRGRWQFEGEGRLLVEAVEAAPSG